MTQAARKLRGRSFQMGGSERLLSLGDELNFSYFFVVTVKLPFFRGCLLSAFDTCGRGVVRVSGKDVRSSDPYKQVLSGSVPVRNVRSLANSIKVPFSFFLKLGYLQSVSEVGPTVNQPESDNTVQRAHFQSQISVALASADHGSG